MQMKFLRNLLAGVAVILTLSFALMSFINFMKGNTLSAQQVNTTGVTGSTRDTSHPKTVTGHTGPERDTLPKMYDDKTPPKKQKTP